MDRERWQEGGLRAFPWLRVHRPRHAGTGNPAVPGAREGSFRPGVRPDLHRLPCTLARGPGPALPLLFRQRGRFRLQFRRAPGSGLRKVPASRGFRAPDGSGPGQQAGIPTQAGWAPSPTSGPRSPDSTGRPGVHAAPSGAPGTGPPGPGREPWTTALPRPLRCLSARGRKTPRHTLQLPQPPRSERHTGPQTTTLPKTHRCLSALWKEGSPSHTTTPRTPHACRNGRGCPQRTTFPRTHRGPNASLKSDIPSRTTTPRTAHASSDETLGASDYCVLGFPSLSTLPGKRLSVTQTITPGTKQSDLDPQTTTFPRIHSGFSAQGEKRLDPRKDKNSQKTTQGA